MNQPIERARLLVVVKMPATRFGVVSFLEREQQLEICGTTGCPNEARALCEKLRPDLILLDPAVSGNGLTLLRDLVRLHPAARPLMFAAHGDHGSVRRAFRAGARGYVTQHEELGAVSTALHKLRTGVAAMSDSVTTAVTHGFSKTSDASELYGKELTAREREVLFLIGRNHATRVVARELGIGVSTVESHRARIRAKLGLRDGAQLLAVAQEYAARNPEVTVMCPLEKPPLPENFPMNPHVEALLASDHYEAVRKPGFLLPHRKR